VIWTAGTSPNPLIATLLCKLDRGRIVTDDYLEALGWPGVWALGDCACITDRRTGRPYPPTAQHALRQGKTVAKNLTAALCGGSKRPFSFSTLGLLASIGRRTGVANILGINFSGFLAWFLWRTIYLMKMPGWGRRLKVAASWTLDLFLPPELVQLRLASSVGLTQEHFEPGQELFRQGDVGDRVYIILSGKVEVLRDEQRIALERGDFFGETALLHNAQRNATVRCLDALDVLALPKREFVVLSASLPELRRGFEAKSEQRARQDASHP